MPLFVTEPFFSEVTKGEKVSLAKNYVFLGEFYRSYVLADSSLVVKGATKENLTDLIKACSDAVSGLQSDKFSGRQKMKSIVYEVVLSVLGSESSSLHAAGINRGSVEKIIKSVQGDPEISPENAALAEETLKAVSLGYQEKEDE